MSKQRHLINKYHWKSRESFIKLFTDSAFSIFGIASKTKNAELAENFLQHVYRKLHFPNSKQRSSKAALAHMPAS